MSQSDFGHIAEQAGASTLRIKGTIANERLLEVLRRRFGVITEGANEFFEIQLR